MAYSCKGENPGFPSSQGCLCILRNNFNVTVSHTQINSWSKAVVSQFILDLILAMVQDLAQWVSISASGKGFWPAVHGGRDLRMKGSLVLNAHSSLLGELAVW